MLEVRHKRVRKMQKSLIFLAVLIVFIAGCTGTPQGSVNASANAQPSGNQPAKQPSGGTPAPSGDKTDLNTCLQSCGIFAQNDLITNCKAGCYLAVALENKNAAQCEEITPYEKNGTVLYDTCIVDVAAELNDSSLCAKAHDDAYHDNCFSIIAEAKADASICNGVKTDIIKDGCISAVAQKKRDPSLCAGVSDFMKDACREGALPQPQ